MASPSLYGGTYNLLHYTFPKIGIEVSFVEDPDDPQSWRRAVRPNTKAFFAETVTNPSLEIADLEKLAAIAHGQGVPFIVDNTFPTPFLCRPIEWGADVVTHSTTKYMDGHAQTVGGVVVDAGTFDWTSGKFPEFCEPDPSYHGISYAKRFGAAAFIVKARVQLQRDIGAQQSPFAAYVVNLGLETLHLRMPRHCSNALAVARHLEKHPAIAWVNYPGLESNPYHSLARKYLPDGVGGVVSFGTRGGREAATRFMDGLQLAAIVTHVADARTCVLHPASTTHRQLSDDQLRAAGISADLVRLSVGIEHVDDILADLDQALAAL